MNIINKTTIQGMGGAGGTYSAAGGAGGDAIKALMNYTIDNTSGNIWGGGGGGGGSLNTWSGLVGLGSGYMRSAGGGGAGTLVGSVGAGSAASGTNIAVTVQPAAGTQAAGGGGARVTNTSTTTIYTLGGTGGAPGVAGGAGTSSNGGMVGYTLTNQLGGAAGKAINLNGFTATFSAGNTATQVKGAVS